MDAQRALSATLKAGGGGRKREKMMMKTEKRKIKLRGRIRGPQILTSSSGSYHLQNALIKLCRACVAQLTLHRARSIRGHLRLWTTNLLWKVATWGLLEPDPNSMPGMPRGTRSITKLTHTRARTHACAHTYTHACMCTRTHTEA